jgi:UDP-3-O-[3-hydroxymyristoyl] glucosamine N-acyltransferase
VIEDGVKIDNLVQIGHNVHVGKHTVLAGCVGVSGSAKIGAHCMIGGGVGIAGHLTIADHVTVAGFSLVSGSIHKAGHYAGAFPIDDNAAWQKNAATVRQLYQLRERVKALEKKS